MLWLAIRFPSLPIEIFLRDNPQCPPLVIREQHQVLFASEAAMACGIRPGLKLTSARMLCEELRILERAQDKELAQLQCLARRQLNITPGVCLEGAEGLLLDIEGSLKLFRGLAPLLDQVHLQLADSGLGYILGLGNTPLSAWLLSFVTCDADPAFHNPGPHDIRQRLEGFPLSLAPLPAKQREALSGSGFRFLGDVLALPRPALGKRFGRHFLQWLQRLLGETPDPRKPVTPPEKFHAEAEFLDPVSHADALLFPARRLVAELESFLKRRHQYTRAISWHFFDNRGHSQTLQIRRAGSGHSEGVWQDLTRRRFEQHKVAAPILKLSLDCEEPLSHTHESEELFSRPEARPDRSFLLDRLGTLPDLQLSTVICADAHVPEQAQRMIHPLHRADDVALQESPFTDLPVWLLEKPVPLQKNQESIYWRRTLLELLPGEKKLASDWWKKTPIQRHYRVARHPLGPYCWVFHSPQEDAWFLHGFF